MSYMNMAVATATRRKQGDGRAASGMPSTKSLRGQARKREAAEGGQVVKPMTVDGRTFMAAAVMLSIDAYLNKRDAVACQEGKEAA